MKKKTVVEFIVLLGAGPLAALAHDDEFRIEARLAASEVDPLASGKSVFRMIPEERVRFTTEVETRRPS